MIYFHQHRFQVGSGSETAIRALRLTIGGQLIWIDAICMNQSNDVDKGHQVLVMNHMYRHTDKVFI